MTSAGSAPGLVMLLGLAGAGAGIGRMLRLPMWPVTGSILGAATAPLVGLGGVVNAQRHPVQRWVRTAGLVLIGCVSAARLDGESLEILGRIVLPVLAAVVLLLVLNAVLARWLILRHGLDPTTAVLACAPGGLSELSVLAVKERADVATVTVIHLVRVLLVVLVALPALVFVLGRSA